jgi:hypothetical protein
VRPEWKWRDEFFALINSPRKWVIAGLRFLVTKFTWSTREMTGRMQSVERVDRSRAIELSQWAGCNRIRHFGIERF